MSLKQSFPLAALMLIASSTSSTADEPNTLESADVIALNSRIHDLEQLVLQLKAERETLTARLTEDAKPLGSVPLKDAVAEFNTTHAGYPNSKSQPPLTVEEVVAAIRFYHRDNAEVTDGEYARFKQVAETRKLPRDSHFEVINSFTGEEYEIQAWSVRLVMPTHNGRRTWAFQVREKMIRSRTLTAQEKANLVRDAGKF